MTHPENSSSLLVITHGGFGRAQGGRRDEALATALNALHKQADVRVAQCRHPRELPAILATRDDRRLVIAGGDGSVHSLVKAMLHRSVLSPTDPLGILPLGDGNDLALLLGIPTDPAEAAEVVLGGRARPLDLLVDDVGGVVINIAHVGVGAEGSRALTPLLHGSASPVGGLVSRTRARGWRLRILVDDSLLWDSLAGMDAIVGTQDDGDRVLLVALGNGRTIGAGTPLLPGAEPDDGLVDVVVSVAARSASKDGSPVPVQDVLTAQGHRVSVLSQEAAFPLNADGEVETGVHGRTWQLQPRAWSVLVPA